MKIKEQRLVKYALFVGAACAALSLAPIGQAGILQSTGLLGQGVTIYKPGGPASGSHTIAGAFTGGTFEGGSLPDFWCIDLSHTVPVPPWPGAGINNYTSASLSLFGGTQRTNLETLFSLYVGSATSSAQNAAAFQLAIWDILFDNNAHSLSDPWAAGTFSVDPSSISATTVSTAQGWINAAVTGPQSAFSLMQLTNSNSPASQSFVYPGIPGKSTPVPEPTGLALLGVGLVAMLVARRRKSIGRLA